MKNDKTRLKISTPGRICLFGEHQDYLQLPVIACAISLRIAIEGQKRDDLEVRLTLPDIAGAEWFVLNGKLPYERERDYFKSTVNVLRKHGYTFSRGFDCTVHGEIPINSGTSSSSALIVTWMNFLAQMSDQAALLSPEVLAKYAHEAEVLEFNEPGGMMDHYSTALGGVIFLSFYPETRYEMCPAPLKTFVLGDSGEPKDTKSILARVKNQIVEVSQQLQRKHADFSLQSVTEQRLEDFRGEMTHEQFTLLKGTVTNRDITLEAKKEMGKSAIDDACIGRLLNAHQDMLRDALKISTPKIDRMIDAALQAGAVGGKINGSGGGGCMFAYAPRDPERVAEAIRRAGGRSYIITPGCGTSID